MCENKDIIIICKHRTQLVTPDVKYSVESGEMHYYPL